MSGISFSLNAIQATGSDNPVLVCVADEVEWTVGEDGRRHPGARIGTRYTVLMLQNACAPLVVKTPEAVPVVTAEAVAAACLSGKFIRVKFENFAATAYQGRNGLGVTATADKAILAAS